MKMLIKSVFPQAKFFKQCTNHTNPSLFASFQRNKPSKYPKSLYQICAQRNRQLTDFNFKSSNNCTFQYFFFYLHSYPMSSQRPIVQNVVSYGRMSLEEDIDLKYLAEKIENSRYNKKRFPALIIRKTKPKCTIMVFKSGKIIVIGSESQKDAELAAKKLGKDIQKALNSKCKLSEFRITNLVANADLGFQIDLHRLADQRLAVKDDSFPGVVYRNLKNLKSALIFHSGKVIFTGATLRTPIQQAYDELKIKLRKFEKMKLVSKKEETQVEDNNKIDHHSPLKKKR